jgi:hypothetical protein
VTLHRKKPIKFGVTCHPFALLLHAKLEFSMHGPLDEVVSEKRGKRKATLSRLAILVTTLFLDSLSRPYSPLESQNIYINILPNGSRTCQIGRTRGAIAWVVGSCKPESHR